MNDATTQPGTVSQWMLTWVPAVRVIGSYQRAWLRRDVVAALVLTALLVPQGMAYAELAGLPAVTGLYTTVTSLVGYAVFGPSRIMVLGPDSSLAPLIATIIAPLVLGDTPAEAVALAGALSILAGLLEIAAGALRLGTVTDLFSMPVRVGYLNGIALLVLVSQLPKLFGFSTDADSFVDDVNEFVRGVFDGETARPALALGAVAMAVMIFGRRWAPQIPWVLVAVIASIVAVALFDLADDGVSVVGRLPSGFPSPALPDVAWDDLGALLAGAAAIAVVSVADTAALSRSFSAKRGERVDQNHEAVGLGAANVLCGLFQGFPTSASSSRTVVAESVGSKTQLTGILAAGAIVILLVGANGLLADLPSSVLAAIVIVASFRLFDLPTMVWLLRVRRTDFLASLTAMLGVILIGVLEGLVIAIGVALAVFIWKRWHPDTAVLGSLGRYRGYHDIERHPEAELMPGVVIFRFNSPLFFANAPFFEEQVLAAISSAPHPVQHLIIAAEPMTDIDSTGAETVDLLLDELDAHDITLSFAALVGPVKNRLRRYGLYDRIGADHFFPTVESAVAAASMSDADTAD